MARPFGAFEASEDGMPQTTRIDWVAVPLVDTSLENRPDRVVIDGTLTLFAGGGLMIENRWFGGNWFFGLCGAEAIDHAFPGGHAYRKKHSNRLQVRTAGPNRQALVYEYRSRWLLGCCEWHQIVPRIR